MRPVRMFECRKFCTRINPQKKRRGKFRAAIRPKKGGLRPPAARGQKERNGSKNGGESGRFRN